MDIGQFPPDMRGLPRAFAVQHRTEPLGPWRIDTGGQLGDRDLLQRQPQCEQLTTLNADMLEVGRARAAERGLDETIAFVEGNAEALPFADRSYDAVTIAFGIRNVPRIAAALSEAHRVLRLGGRFLCLEFSTVDVPGLDALYDFYSFNVIPALGGAVAGDAEAYRYLVESIRRFPRPDAFAEMMRAAGFARASFQRMSGGIVALHSGWRL